MSSHSARKKRFGSRRPVLQKNEAEEFHVKDSASVAQHHIPGGSTESLNVLSNPDYSKSEPQNPPSAEVIMYRRKIGSSRKNKGRQFVKESGTELYLGPGEMSNEKLSDSVAESNKSDETYLLAQEISLQGSDLVSEPHVESVVSEFITPEKTTDKSSPRDNTETECSVEQETFSLPKEEFPTSEKQNELFNLSEVRIAQHSEIIANKVHEDDVKPLQMQDMHQRDYSLEALIVDATEHADTCSVNLKDQTRKPENRNIFQSVMSVRHTEDSATKPGASNPNEKHEEDPEFNQSNLFQQALPSEINAPVDSQLQDNSVNINEQTDTAFDTSGHRRKLGASRRNKGRQRIQESKEVSENTSTDETPEKINMSTTTETMRQEELSQRSNHGIILSAPHGSSMFLICAPGSSSEVQNPSVTDKSDTLQSEEVKGVHHSEDAVKKVLEEEVKPTQIQETLKIDHTFGSVIDDENSEVVSGNLTDQTEIRDTDQSQLMVKRADDSAANLNPDDTQDEDPTKENNLETSDFKNDHDHVHDSQQPWINIQTIDGAQGQMSENEGQVEDDIKHNVVQTVHKDKETVLSEVEKNISFVATLPSETNAPVDSQLPDNPVSIDEQHDTSFDPSGHRRKLGSSRKNKGRQRAKESREEVSENDRVDEASEKVEMSSTTETMRQEEFSQGRDHDIILSVQHNSSKDPETDLERLFPKGESVQEDEGGRETDFKVEVSDKSVEATQEGADISDTLQSGEVRGVHHSEDAVKKVLEEEVKPTQIQDMLKIDHTFGSVIDDAPENSEVVSGNLTDQTEIRDTDQSQLMVKHADDSAAKLEVSNPDDKQDEDPTKENYLETSDLKNDYHVHDSQQPWINIQRIDSAKGQMSENEGQVEDDIKHNVVQTVHTDKEIVLSEVEKNISFVATLPSETNAPVNSQLPDNLVSIDEQHDTSFDPSGHRRKLGSSRKNKGRQRAKESREKEPENTRVDEASEKINMSSTTETLRQEELSHDSILSVQHNSSMFSVSAPGYSSVVQNQSVTKDPETDLERLFPKGESVQEDEGGRETDFKVEVSDKSVEATQEGADISDTLQSEEVRGVHHSEDAVKKVLEEEVKPTQIQEMLKIDHTFGSVIDDAPENSELVSGNLTDQTEIRDTDQSQLMVKHADDSAAKLEVSNPDDKQDEDPTKENYLETSDLKKEGYHAYDSQQPWINIERIDSAKGQMSENEGQVEDDIEHNAEQTLHQDKELVLSEVEKSNLSLQSLPSEINTQFDSQFQDNSVSVDVQTVPTDKEIVLSEVEKNISFVATLPSETNAPVDSQLPDNPMSVDEQHDTSFDPSGHRRKLGLSRKNKGRQRAKESNEKVSENDRVDEASEKEEMSSTTETMREEEFSQGRDHDIILSVQHNSSKDSETDLKCLFPKGESVQEDDDERETDFKVEVSDKSVEATQEGADISDTLQSGEVRGVHHSEDAVKKVLEEEVKPTQIQETLKIDHTSGSVIDDENSEVVSGNLTDQTEIRDTDQSQLMVKRADDSAAKLEVSNPDDTQDEDPTKENNLETSDLKNDYHVHDSQQPWINIQTIDGAQGQMSENEGQVEDDIKHNVVQTVPTDKETVLSEFEKNISFVATLPSETNAPVDSQLPDNPVSIDEQHDTSFDPSGHRRKLGSSRKNKGRQRAKESREEVSENTRVDEASEKEEMSSTETMTQEEFSQGRDHDIILSVQHNSSKDPETDLERLFPKGESVQEDEGERETDFKVEVSDKSVEATQEGADISDTLQSEEVRGVHHSEDAVKKVLEEEVKPTQIQDMLKIDHTFGSVIDDAPENSEVVSGNLTDQTEIRDTDQSQLMVKRADDSAAKLEVSNPDDTQDEDPTKENNLETSDLKSDYHVHDSQQPWINIERIDSTQGQMSENEGQVEDDIEHNVVQTVHTDKEIVLSEVEKNISFVVTLPSETNAAVDSQLPDHPVSIDEHPNTGFDPSGHRRKLGSSRKNKGRQRAKESKEEVSENDRVDEKIKKSSTTETFKQEELNQGSNQDFFLNLTDQPETRETGQCQLMVESADDSAAKLEVSDPDDKQDGDPIKENNFETLDQTHEGDHLFNINEPKMSDTERIDTALGVVYDIESEVKDDIKPSAEKTSHQDKEGLFSEMKDSESTLQSHQCGMHASLDSQPQPNDTSFNSGGNRRKLGSSQEKSMETMLEGMDKSDTPQTEDISVHIKQTAHSGTLAGISSSSLHASLAADLQLIESNSSEMQDEGIPTVYSVTNNKEMDEDTEMLRQDRNSQGNNLLSESHVMSENIETSVPLEITIEKSNPRAHAEDGCSVEQETFSSPNQKLPTNEEQNEYFKSSEVRGVNHSEDVVSEAHNDQNNSPQVQEMHQIVYSPVMESRSSLQTPPAVINAPLAIQPQDNFQSGKDKTHSGLNPAGNRGKLDSSQGSIGRENVKHSVVETHKEHKEEVVENTRGDETSQTTTMTLPTKTTGQEEIRDSEKVRKMSSTQNENTEKLPEEDMLFPTSSDKDDFLKSNKDVGEKDKKQEPENLSQLTGCDTVKMYSKQPPQASGWKDDSDVQNISYHNDSVSDRTRTVNEIDREKASPAQDIQVQETSDVRQTVGYVVTEDSNTEVEIVQRPEQDEVREKGVHAAQQINSSPQVASAAQESAVDVSDESGISSAMDAHNSQQEKTHSHQGANLKIQSQQKRRRMVSTRRSVLNRKPEAETDDGEDRKESDSNREADVRNLDKMGVVAELPLTVETTPNENAPPLLGTAYKEQQEANESSSVHEECRLQRSTSDLQSTDSNVIPGINDLTHLLPEQSASNNEEVTSQVTYVKVDDVKDGEGKVDVSGDQSQLDDFTSTEMQKMSVIAGRSRRSVNQLLPPNTDTAANTGITGESLQNDEERPQSLKVIQEQDTDENEPNDEAYNKNLEEENTSSDFYSTNSRRKMGSTRKSLGLRTKAEDLHEKQDVDNEATKNKTVVRDVTMESVPVIEEKELQVDTEHKGSDSENGKEKVLETVEYVHVSESEIKPPPQPTAEENPVSEGQLAKTEHQLTPNDPPSTSPENDAMSESASVRKKRKMGSHRKSRENQSHKGQSATEGRIIDAQTGDVRKITEEGNITEEGEIKTTKEHREESSGLDKISEVDESDKKPFNISKAAEPSKLVSEKTSVQAEIRLVGESQKQFSLAGNPTNLRSNSYNVVMVGDSSVGKTSFMKRAQSGKFSLDLPASVGLDSCKWTVVVDGKPVVLHLWDTAGQERFRSITRQVFHKAQAFLLMYDVTASQSFSAVSYWANCIQEAAAEDVTVLLLGNKSDQAQRQVKTQQGEILAKEYNFAFMECSAATGENVIQSLETVARMLSQRSDTREETTVLHKEPEQNKRSRCC